MKKVFFLACVGMAFVCCSFGGENFSNLRDFINGEIAAGKKIIKVPEGRYELEPSKGSHLLFDGLSDISIDARGVELVCKQTVNAILVRNCKNFKIEGLSIDYDPLPYTQGKIVAMSEDKQIHEIELFGGYRGLDMIGEANRYEIFDKQKRILKTITYEIKSYEKLSDRKLRVAKRDYLKNHPFKNEEIGDIVVFSMPSRKGAGGHAVMALNSVGVTFKDITLYTSPAFGFYDGECDKVLYDSVRIARRDKNDYAAREVPRVRSLNADGFHSGSAACGPTYLNCECSWNGDDSIAVHGSYYLVWSDCRGDSLRVSSRSGKFPFKAGDKIEIFKTDASVEYAKIEEISRGSPPTKEEIAWFETLPIYPVFKTTKSFYGDIYTIRLDRPVEVARRSMIMNTAQMGNGFKIKGGKFGNNRSRGIILKAGGIVDGAEISGSWMESIKVAPEWYWFEGGHSDSLIIKNCTIRCGSGPAISINSPTLDEKAFSPAGADGKVSIKNNTFRYAFNPCIFATSIGELKMSGNKLVLEEEPIYNYKYRTHMRVVCDEPVVLINCKNAE